MRRNIYSFAPATTGPGENPRTGLCKQDQLLQLCGQKTAQEHQTVEGGGFDLFSIITALILEPLWLSVETSICKASKTASNSVR